MITKEELKSYKSIIGKNYSNKILEFFVANDYKKAPETPYTAQNIFDFFSGRYDLQLHIKIVEVATHYKMLTEELEQKRQKLLATKKPEAATSGD